MAQGKIINDSKSGNYVSGNKVFILDKFSSQTSNELIGNLSDMVSVMPQATMYQSNQPIVSPYDIENIDNPIIDVYINSNGGDGAILDSINTLLSIAKLNGAIIRTTVLSKAHSCGSLLAITGTPGFRIMYSQAYHLVHFGHHSFGVSKEDEITMAAKQIKEHCANKRNMYLQHTNLTAAHLRKLQSTEQGFLNANDCLKYGLCDWVINDFGKIRTR